MNFKKFAGKVISFLFITHAAYANNVVIQTVPFQNVFVNPNQFLQANFNIGQHREIFCFANNVVNLGKIYWPYQGTIKNGPMPMLLTTNSASTGEFTDPSGVLNILNNTTTGIYVSCLFGF